MLCRTHLASAVHGVRDERANILTRLQQDRNTRNMGFLRFDPANSGLFVGILVSETRSTFSIPSTMSSHDNDPFYLRYVLSTCTV